MNYGTSAYGSTSFSGAAASGWFIFFSYLQRDEGLYEAQLVFAGGGQFFSIFTNQSNSDILVEYKAYTANDENETPQLQTTFSGRGQAVIGSAQFITVTAQTPEFGERFSVMGRIGN